MPLWHVWFRTNDLRSVLDGGVVVSRGGKGVTRAVGGAPAAPSSRLGTGNEYSYFTPGFGCWYINCNTTRQ